MKNEYSDSIKIMVEYVRANGLVSQVAEFNRDGDNFEGALEYVYDSHVLTKEQFRNKYFR